MLMRSERSGVIGNIYLRPGMHEEAIMTGRD